MLRRNVLLSLPAAPLAWLMPKSKLTSDPATYALVVHVPNPKPEIIEMPPGATLTLPSDFQLSPWNGQAETSAVSVMVATKDDWERRPYPPLDDSWVVTRCDQMSIVIALKMGARSL